jgi:hypothetical protein
MHCLVIRIDVYLKWILQDKYVFLMTVFYYNNSDIAPVNDT